MMRKIGWGVRPGALFNENKGSPWGSGGGSGGDDGGSGGGSGGGPRSPWGGQPRRRRPSPVGNVGSLDDFLKKSRDRFGGGLPSGDGKSYLFYGLAALLLLWLAFTSLHLIGPQQRGVITRFGKYAGTLDSGMGVTLPWPIDSVEILDVAAIRSKDIGTPDPSNDNLILTSDQNIIDMAYSVRWNIKDPQLFLFQMKDPEDTISEVAQSTMRAVVARVSLSDAIGSGRQQIEDEVALRMQKLLDAYHSGVRIQGVAIRQSDPPAAVNDAFKEVTAAQQEAQSYMNQARAYAQQLTAKAQGEAAAFDKVYAQYKLSPEVTRRRMYYETMEDVLSRVDKTVVEAPGVTPYLALPELRNRPQAGGDQ